MKRRDYDAYETSGKNVERGIPDATFADVF